MDVIPFNQRYAGSALAQVFNQVCIERWEYRDNKKFDLVELVDRLTRGFTGNSRLKSAMNTVAKMGVNSYSNQNEFHNAMHTAQVVMMAAYFAKQARMINDDYLLLVLCAVSHDQWHPGRPNPEDDMIANERKASDDLRDIMERCGIEESMILDSETIVHSTSPNGPHDFVKGAVDSPVVKSQKRLVDNPRLMKMAQILCDADIFVSAGVDMGAVIMASDKLNAEYAKAGIDIDFNNPEVRMYFLDNIVGKNGFCSDIAKELANDNFFEIRRQTQLALNPK